MQNASRVKFHDLAVADDYPPEAPAHDAPSVTPPEQERLSSRQNDDDSRARGENVCETASGTYMVRETIS
jgi:hypothetical protein